MEFLDKITKKASQTYKGAAQKTGKIAKEAKLKMKINDNKCKICDLYEEIGKKVYQKHILDEELEIKKDLEEECTKIDILVAENETFHKQILGLSNLKQCNNCKENIEKDAKFCPNCGKQQPIEDVEPETFEAEVIDDENINSTSEEYVDNDSSENTIIDESQEDSNNAVIEEEIKEDSNNAVKEEEIKEDSNNAVKEEEIQEDFNKDSQSSDANEREDTGNNTQEQLGENSQKGAENAEEKHDDITENYNMNRDVRIYTEGEKSETVDDEIVSESYIDENNKRDLNNQ